MTGVSTDVEFSDQAVRELLTRLQAHISDLTPVMKIIGETVRTSVVANFEKGGRPAKWKALSSVTKARRKGGKKILMVQGLAGGLAGSIHFTAGKNKVVIGTDKVYAAVQQFGAKKGSFGTVTAYIKAHVRKTKSGKKVGVRAHTRKAKLPWGDIPARPFLMMQAGDWDEIRREIVEYIGGTI